MTDAKITFEQKLAALKADYAKQLPQKLLDIKAGWQELNSQWSEASITLLHRNVHSLIGTSGTFGFTDLSKSARALETTLKPLIDNKEEYFSPSPELASEINTQLNHLFTLLDEIQGAKKTDAQTTLSAKLGEQLSSYNQSGNSGTSGENTLIYYVDDELAGPSLLTQQLSSYGFKVSHFRSMQSFLVAFEKEKPHLVMLDLVMPDINEADIFFHAKNISTQGTKVIFLSFKLNFPIC